MKKHEQRFICPNKLNFDEFKIRIFFLLHSNRNSQRIQNKWESFSLTRTFLIFLNGWKNNQIKLNQT